jgi:antitoxin component YwqK of YwqJK toxin-antitoxin module
MTTDTPSPRPVKYASLEWRNQQGEKFDNYQEGAVCHQKDADTPFSGKAVDLYDSGEMAIEGNFLEGMAHGEETWWFENGNKNSLVTYQRGERHGPHLVWYENGQLQVDVCYNTGKRDGRHAVYYESGQVRSEAYFANDKLEGTYTTWFEDGSNRSERVFKAGKEIKRCEWKRGGEQKQLKNWKADGSPV